MKYISILIASLAFFTNCSEKESKPDLFSTNHNVKSETIIGEDVLLDPWKIQITDSFLVLVNKEGSPILETYGFDGSAKNKFLTKGNGPHEIVVVGGLQSGNKSNSIIVTDLFRDRSLFYDLNKQTNMPDSIIDYKPFQRDSTVLVQYVIHTDQYLIGESKSPKGRIALMDNTGKLIKYEAKFPEKIFPRVSDYENLHLYGVSMTYCPVNKTLATATSGAGLLDVYKIGKNDINQIWSRNDFLQKHLEVVEMGETLRIAFTKDCLYGYPAITSTSKYVYALFSGRKFDQQNYAYGNMIRIMDWDSKKGCTLHTDIDIKDLAVDESNNYIYAVGLGASGEQEVVRFTIGDIIKSL